MVLLTGAIKNNNNNNSNAMLKVGHSNNFQKISKVSTYKFI